MNESGRRREAPELRIVSCLLLVIPWMGCASIAGYSGIVISNFKSPITWEMQEKFPVNKPLDPEVHEALADRTRKLADGVEAGALEAACEVLAIDPVVLS